MSENIYYSIDFVEKINVVSNKKGVVKYIKLNSNDIMTYTISSKELFKRFKQIDQNTALHNNEPILYIKRSKNI